MKNNPGYIGRYTVAEYAQAKHRMIQEHPELKPGQIEEICRYVATKDWPADRRDTFIFAKNSNDFTANFLRLYDECQWIFDEIHHGEGFLRFFEEYVSIPESKHEFSKSLVEKALKAGTYTGLVPSRFQHLITKDQEKS